MVNNAIILAAGQGTRAKNLTKGVPKGFIKINGEYIIETSIKKLIKQGIANICIVYGKEHFKWKELKRKYPFLIMIQNTEWNNSELGSAHTLSIGMNYFHDTSIILESDIIYTSNILHDCIHSRYFNVIMCTPKLIGTDKIDEYYVSKNIESFYTHKGGKDESIGKDVLIGISKMSYENYKSIIFKSFNYEEEFNQIDSVLILSRKEYRWQEIDNKEQYNLAIRECKNIALIDNYDKDQIENNKRILFNPGPLSISEGVRNSLMNYDICPREKEFGEVVQEIRKSLVGIYYKTKWPSKKETKNTLYQTCLFAGSGTLAVESTIVSNTSKDDINLIFINGDKNSSYSKRIAEIHDSYGLKYVILENFNHTAIKLCLSDYHFKNVFIVHHETSTGELNNVNEISKQIREISPKTNIIVDAMSSFGLINIDIKKIDFLISSSNKILGGVPGISFVICNKNKVKKSKGSYYLNLYDNLKHQNDNNGQFRFTPPVQVLYAFRQAVREYFIWKSHHKYYTLYNNLLNTLEILGFELYKYNCLNESKILISIKIPDWMNFQDYHDFLYKNNITIYPGKSKEYFRMSIMGNLSLSNIHNFSYYTNMYLKQNKKQITSHELTRNL